MCNSLTSVSQCANELCSMTEVILERLHSYLFLFGMPRQVPEAVPASAGLDLEVEVQHHGLRPLVSGAVKSFTGDFNQLLSPGPNACIL